MPLTLKELTKPKIKVLRGLRGLSKVYCFAERAVGTRRDDFLLSSLGVMSVAALEQPPATGTQKTLKPKPKTFVSRLRISLAPTLNHTPRASWGLGFTV